MVVVIKLLQETSIYKQLLHHVASTNCSEHRLIQQKKKHEKNNFKVQFVATCLIPIQLHEQTKSRLQGVWKPSQVVQEFVHTIYVYMYVP